MDIKKEDKREITCKHCKHTWETTSRTLITTCAGCGKKTPNIRSEKKNG